MSINFEESLVEIQKKFFKIYDECGKTFWKGCGSYLFNGQSYDYYEGMKEKQKLLFDLSKKHKSVLEIGTYMGHSSLIMLAANPTLKIVTIDIDPTYSTRSINYLSKDYPMADVKLLLGNSHEIIPTLSEKFDFFHIDGHHENSHVEKEIELCMKLASSEIVTILFDDVECCWPSIWHIQKNYRIVELIVPNSEWQNALVVFKK